MVEIARILCACDFSGYSRRALQQACRIAERHGSSLTVLHVIPASLPATGPFAALTNPALLYPNVRQDALASLRRFVDRTGPATRPAQVEVREGAPPAEIVRRAAELQADLLVLGTHGRGGFEKWALGSVAERVLRKARCPVLTVPARGPLPSGAALFGTIVWPTDFSPAATAALPYATSLARQDRARLLLLHVVAHEAEPGPPGSPPDLATELQERARECLRRAVPLDLRRHCTVEEIVAVGKPHREIARIGRERGAELIVMGAQGADALDLLIFGSTAQRVVRIASCPVLTVPAG
jgi:nucleotide-binding universal stress UspA family protein